MAAAMVRAMSAAAGEPESESSGGPDDSGSGESGVEAYALLLAARFPWAGDDSILQAATFLRDSDIEADGMDGSLGRDPLLVGRLMKEASTLAEIVDPPPVLG